MPDFKLVVSLRANDQFRSKLSEAERYGADLIEVRLDHIGGSTLSTALEAATPYFDRCILTCRSRAEGGLFEGDIREMSELLLQLIELVPAYLDIELATAETRDKVVRRASDAGIRTIVSWHHFSDTPCLGLLREKVLRTMELGAIGKIVTMAQSAKDNLTMLSLYREENEGRLVAFAMGEVGVLSRVASVLIGAPMAYVSLPGEPLAPGQLSIEEFRRFIDILGSND